MKTMGRPGITTYSSHEVIEFRDDEHLPYNKRAGECESSSLIVQFRAPIHRKWISIQSKEITTTKRLGKEPRTHSRVISFTITREQFDEIVAHINRSE